ncbi:hypothetical protein QZN11_36280 [Streptomyces gramineus]|jgi:hypothetical protein|uniref:hypothetical protein n=1 Tax=Streptomyces gramineus TaxID=910542 RepID=UPI00398B9548
MAELDVDTGGIKPAVEQMRLTADKFKSIMDQMRAAVTEHRDASGNDSTGAKFREQHDPAAANMFAALQGYSGTVAATADRIDSLGQLLVKTEDTAGEEAARIAKSGN